MNKMGMRAVRRKGQRRFSPMAVLDRAAYEDADLDTKVALIQELIPLGLLHVQETLQAEVQQLAGERHARKTEAQAGRRYGHNPGSVKLAGQKLPIAVPRVRGAEGEIPLASYGRLHDGDGEVDERLLRRVLYGISCGNYGKAARAVPGAMGLSRSSVSREFVAASAAQLKAFQERELSDEDYVALFLDGKVFADATMVIALGITMRGEKRILGFVETDTENQTVLSGFLRSLLDRGLDIAQGILVIIDGGKGLRAAVRKVFAKRALVQRCMWHKRENVVSHLPLRDQAAWRRRLQKAMDRPTYAEAKAALERLIAELDTINQSAAASLREGFDEVLTLHRLGVFAQLGRSFKTTNCLENINGLIEDRCAKVDCWKNSNQRQRWLAAALLDIEPRLRTVRGYRHLRTLRDALQREL
ncbi:MAG: IS256 family transposase, partial [Candidatus Diapherotrites archaeon]